MKKHMGAKSRVYNKYDIFVTILIVALIGGGSGGALEPIRWFSILFAPIALSLYSSSHDKHIMSYFRFFAFWYMYMILSLAWTSDFRRGLNELVYYPIHFMLFLEILLFSQKARNPIQSISLAWLVAFLLTSLVAIWEIRTDHHLSFAVQTEDSVASVGFDSFYYRFASVTFGNYNTYNTFICYSIPFILYSFAIKYKISRIFSFTALLLSAYIIITNASRGAIASLILMAFIYSWMIFFRNRSIKSKLRIIFIISITALFLLYNWFTISGHLLFRMTYGDIGSDENRMVLWSTAISIFFNSFGFGAGVGSLTKSMAETGHIVPHNAFLELLLQYGLIIFIVVIKFLLKIFRRFQHIKDLRIRGVGYCALIVLPLYLIIDSTYMLKPQLWVLIASLYVFSTYKNDNKLGVAKWR